MELTFPSLYGSDCCLARYDESEGVWQICVNPFSQLFEPRASMKMKTGSLVRIPRKKSYLDFGWRNYEFEEQYFYKRAGTTGNVLKKQVITTIPPAHTRARTMRTPAHALCLSLQAKHSDHRRKVDKGLFFLLLFHSIRTTHSGNQLKNGKELALALSMCQDQRTTQCQEVFFLLSFPRPPLW